MEPSFKFAGEVRELAIAERRLLLLEHLLAQDHEHILFQLQNTRGVIGLVYQQRSSLALLGSCLRLEFLDEVVEETVLIDYFSECVHFTLIVVENVAELGYWSLADIASPVFNLLLMMAVFFVTFSSSARDGAPSQLLEFWLFRVEQRYLADEGHGLWNRRSVRNDRGCQTCLNSPAVLGTSQLACSSRRSV